MPVSAGFREYVLEQLGQLVAIDWKRMFGGVGLYADGRSRKAEKSVDSTGVAIVHLRSASTPGTAEVTVNVKGRADIARRITATFNAADSQTTLVLTSERATAPADDFTSTAVTAQLGAGVPQAGRSVVFSTTQGKFLQTGNQTATVTADQAGRARVDLVGTQTPAIARVSAVAFQITQEVLVQFVPAPPDLILVKPAKLTIETGSGDAATTGVVIELYRNVGKASVGLIPSIRVVSNSGAELPFLIRSVSPSAADGKSQAQITSGTSPVGTARIEVRVDGSTAVGAATIEVVAPKAE